MVSTSDKPLERPLFREDAESSFLLLACQGGAESALEHRQRRLLPGLVKAAWRRGVVTFRVQADHALPTDLGSLLEPLVFARAALYSLGQVAAGTEVERVLLAAERFAGITATRVHVWKRDPRIQADPDAIARVLAAACLPIPAPPGTTACPGDVVLDCGIDAEDRWWLGWHRAAGPSTCWPGGCYPVALPEDKVSRAWLKLDEAITSFMIPLEPGQRACELGAAPGGACQRLLEAGLDVIGVDPAEIKPAVVAHPRFTQWRMRARDVKLRLFRGFDWLVADMNIDPVSTMAALERAVSASRARPRGLIATLKLPDWSRADDLDDWLKRMVRWGYEPRARQLSTAGREVCVVALRR
jgi:23S rRNA (cytidine2498-2'-O)-methyltransferase